jgi:hypothetical protein
MTGTKLYEKALHRVQHSPTLALHEETIMYEWNEGDYHLRWVVKAPIADIHRWAEAVEGAAK